MCLKLIHKYSLVSSRTLLIANVTSELAHSSFPKAEPRETLRFEENKISCFPRDQSLSHLLYSTTKAVEEAMWKKIKSWKTRWQSNTTSHHLQSHSSVHVQQRSTYSRVTVHSYPLTSQILQCCPLRDFWRQFLLLDVTSKLPMRARAVPGKFQLYNNFTCKVDVNAFWEAPSSPCVESTQQNKKSTAYPMSSRPGRFRASLNKDANST